MVIPPVGKGSRHSAHRGVRDIMSDGDMGQIGVFRHSGNCCQVAEPGVKTGASTVIMDVEECRVLEGVSPTESDLERLALGDRCGCRRHKLVQTSRADLVAPPWCLADEAQLLEHDVEELVRVDSDGRKPSQNPLKGTEVWLKRLGRDTNAAGSVNAVVRSPIRRIVAAVRKSAKRAEGLPDTPVGVFLLQRRRPPRRLLVPRVSFQSV